MSILLLAAAGMGGIYVAGNNIDQNNKKLAEQQKTVEAAKNVASRPMWTGAYGNFSDMHHVEWDPSNVQQIVVTRDLSGVPCRYIKMQNGGNFLTYNMQYP